MNSIMKFCKSIYTINLTLDVRPLPNSVTKFQSCTYSIESKPINLLKEPVRVFVVRER